MLRNGIVVTVDEDNRILTKGTVRVDDRRITAVEPSTSETTGDGADQVFGSALRANKRETTDWLKFTLEGAGERTHGYAFTDTTFAGCWI